MRDEGQAFYELPGLRGKIDGHPDRVDDEVSRWPSRWRRTCLLRRAPASLRNGATCPQAAGSSTAATANLDPDAEGEESRREQAADPEADDRRDPAGHEAHDERQRRRHHPGRELGEIMDAERLLDPRDLGDSSLEPLRAEERALFLLEGFAEGIVLLGADERPELGEQDGRPPRRGGPVHPRERPSSVHELAPASDCRAAAAGVSAKIASVTRLPAWCCWRSTVTRSTRLPALSKRGNTKSSSRDSPQRSAG